ncbi:lamin tail domain-containing protein [Jatrophihabitans sp. DSM 45814]
MSVSRHPKFVNRQTPSEAAKDSAGMRGRAGKHKAVAVFSAVALATTGLVALASVAAAAPSSTVVISEVYGGGGNAGAPLTNDFIELYNASASTVDLTGWSVQYASASGTSYQVTQLTGSVAAGGFYLVQEGAGAAMPAPLPTPDAVGSIAMSAAAGKVALVTSTVALGCAAACHGAPGVQDFVGYGTANDFEGAAAAPGLTNSTSDQRSATEADTDANSADFVAAAPTPKAAGTSTGGGGGTDCGATPTPDACVPGTVTIQDVQGSSWKSPLDGQSVTKVPGIVTAVRTAGSSKGFFMQEPNPDPTRPAASSGVFVFTSSASVAVGDSVLVTGAVKDFYPLASGETLSTTSSLSTTEIDPTLVTTIQKGVTPPSPLLLTSTTVPDQFAAPGAADAPHSIETTSPLDPARSAQEFFEAHEGMLVELDNAKVVGPGNEFGEIYVTTKPGEQMTPRGGTYIAGYDQVPAGRLLVTPVSGTVPAANVGDQLNGPTTGPVDWSTFGGYDIAATQVGSYQNNGLTGTSATPQAADQLAVATYNVENLAPSDPQSKFDRLAAGVVKNLASPDIISVEEIQDNDGATDDGVVAADVTITKFTDAIVAAGGPAYQSASVNPVNDADGGQPGGNIRVVFLYNPVRVSFDAKAGGDSTTAVTVSTGSDHTAELSASPGRVDPTNVAWTDSRKPLAGEFTFDGKKVIVVGNHFDSKLGDQDSDGRYQPAARSSEIQRTEQATVLNGFVKQVLAADPRANVVLAGDFNDYQFSAPVKTLTDDGATLTDLINTLPQDEQYTYNFNGISQVLDHIFVSKPLTDAGVAAVQYDVIHINSEFADQVSDHDPQVVRIRPVAAIPPVQKGTIKLAPSTVAAGKNVKVTLDGWSPSTPLTLLLDTTHVASVTTNAQGKAAATVAIPRATTVGAHKLTAQAADGTSVAANLQVQKACVLPPGPSGTLAQWVQYLLALLTGKAC